MNESHYQEVIAESVRMLTDLTTRMDERLKMVYEKQSSLDEDYDTIRHTVQTVVTKLAILEANDHKQAIEDMFDRININDKRILHLEGSSKSSENRWKLIADFVYKAAWVIIVCWLLLKLNLQAPPLP